MSGTIGAPSTEASALIRRMCANRREGSGLDTLRRALPSCLPGLSDQQAIGH